MAYPNKPANDPQTIFHHAPHTIVAITEKAKIITQKAQKTRFIKVDFFISVAF